MKKKKANIPVTAVKVISTVDYMLASGCSDGNINIFQIPKSHPDSIPDSLKPKNQQVERYTVSDLHKTPITALEWAKNGMKLFSGDKNGCVVLTELDFYMVGNDLVIFENLPTYYFFDSTFVNLSK